MHEYIYRAKSIGQYVCVQVTDRVCLHSSKSISHFLIGSPTEIQYEFIALHTHTHTQTAQVNYITKTKYENEKTEIAYTVVWVRVRLVSKRFKDFKGRYQFSHLGLWYD